MKRVLHLTSGGLDSAVLLYDLLGRGHDVKCLGFYYGQRHIRELDYARMMCRELKVWFDVQSLAKSFAECFLTGGDGSVVVPNRNAVMLHVAAARAVGLGCEVVTFGANASDRDGFPDCRWAFIDSVNHSLKLAQVPVQVEAPFVNMTKREIVDHGFKLEVPFDKTWSCYAGGQQPCGECDACKKRKEAFK